jgi:hypothetical protein
MSSTYRLPPLFRDATLALPKQPSKRLKAGFLGLPAIARGLGATSRTSWWPCPSRTEVLQSYLSTLGPKSRSVTATLPTLLPCPALRRVAVMAGTWFMGVLVRAYRGGALNRHGE